MRDNGTISPDELTTRQHKAIVALLQNVTVTGAAQESGVAESTLYRWLSQPSFKLEFRRQRRMMFERAVGLAQRASTAAIAEIIEVMRSGDNEFARLAAAKVILELARETDIEQRVAEIEEMLDDTTSPSPTPTSVPQLRSVS
jgi:phage terminase small subunit